MRQTRHNLFLFFAIAAILCLPEISAAQQAEIKELASKMPNGANAIMVVNVNQIRQSGLAQSKKWFDSETGKIDSGMNMLPLGTNLVLLSARMDFQNFHASWTAALVNKIKVPSIQEIRDLTDGRIDEVMGAEMVETPDDYFIMPISETTVAGLQPAQRSVFINWVRRLKNEDSPRVADYLEQGLGYAKEGTDLTMAFNLRNHISRRWVADLSRDSEALRANGISVGDFSRLVASAEGVTVTVDVADKINCEIRMDFAEDLAALQPVVEKMVTEFINLAGIHLEEFDSWKPNLNGKSISMGGELSTASFRKIISLIDGPRNEAMATADEHKAASHDDPLTATRNYFAAVNSLVQDVQSRLSTGQAMNRNARWLRSYANKVDNLSILNVDAKMVDFGVFVAGSLRDASSIVNNARADTSTSMNNLIASGARSGGGTGGRWRSDWGGGRRTSGRGTGQRVRDATRNNIRTDTETTVRQIFTDISSETGQIRREMTQKFQVEF